MSHLYEIIFEKIDQAHFNEFIDLIIVEDENVKNPQEVGFLDYLQVILKKNILHINLYILNIDNVVIRNVGVRCLYYDGKIDLELNFNLEDIESNTVLNLAEVLMNFSKKYADIYSIKNYFAGMEPASDINTRIFTKEILGPLNLNI